MYWSYGVMVSTLDFESSDPSSNLGRTYVLITKLELFEIELINYSASLRRIFRKGLSEVGFEPTPTFVDQNTQSATISQRRFTLESGALDRSAILTTR